MASATYVPLGLRWADCVGTGPPEQRLRKLDQDGVDAEVLYPGPGSRSLMAGVNDRASYNALIQGYNDWLAEEFCAVAPDRLIGLGLLPVTYVDGAIAAMEHCARLGFKGVDLAGWPSGQKYPTAADDRFWAAVIDMDMTRPSTSPSGASARSPLSSTPLSPRETRGPTRT